MVNCYPVTGGVRWPKSNWEIPVEGDPAVQAGWHTFTATILADYILYELDLGANGGVDFRRIITTSGGPGKVYNVLRLGGPSGNGSAAGGAGFDNVSISTFEPIKGIFSTGIGNDSTNLDPHWTVQRPASATSPVAMTLGLPTFEVPNDGFPIPPWAANTASSQWISAAPNQDANDTPGFYDYSIDFVLAPGETNYRILGNWAADDLGVNIFLNGVGTGQTAPGFGGLVPFMVENGFLAGNNRLTFRVQNAGTAANPTGVRVNFSSFGVIVVPEPATFALGTLGAFALLGGRRRRCSR